MLKRSAKSYDRPSIDFRVGEDLFKYVDVAHSGRFDMCMYKPRCYRTNFWPRVDPTFKINCNFPISFTIRTKWSIRMFMPDVRSFNQRQAMIHFKYQKLCNIPILHAIPVWAQPPSGLFARQKSEAFEIDLYTIIALTYLRRGGGTLKRVQEVTG